jgi:FKBP-type peptidyl-prolyl cis-trans isomerase SlyD
MKPQIVSFHCVLKNQVGKVLSSTYNRDVLTEADADQAAPRGLAEGLRDLKPGERRSIRLSAADAYGYYDPSLVIEVGRKKLDPSGSLRTGDRVLVKAPDGAPKLYQVSQITLSRVTLDGNHPLAGQDLIFEIEATEARDATAEELAEHALTSPPPRLH